MSQVPSETVTMSWPELVAAATGPSEMPEDYRASRWEPNDGEWAGCSWEEALMLARAGWRGAELEEARAFARSVSRHVVTDRLATTFAPTLGVEGSDIDIARYLSGEPEHMLEAHPIRHSARGRAVRLAVPICCPSSVGPRTIRQRGAAILALVDVLTVAQHPLEVWAVDARHSRGEDRRYARAILVQPGNAPLDSARLMFALAHPAMLRRLVFAVDEGMPLEYRVAFGISIGQGYGRAPYDIRPGDLPPVRGTDIVLPPLEENADWSPKAARRWIEQTLQEIQQ